MSFCVLVHISKNSISFWYQQQGAPFGPLAIKDGNNMPLYFYAKENDFILGSAARERFLNGDQVNAFGNYFDIIANPANYFTVYGNKKHVKFLMYYAVEQYLSHFLNTVLYKNESIEGYRDNFPLRFIFSNDVAQKERLLVESIFKESGYDNVESLSYTQFLFNFLTFENLINPQIPSILLTGLNGDLFIELYSNVFINPISHVIVEEQGSDPRIKYMAKMIYDDAMSTTRLNLDVKKELTHLLPYAKEFLSQDSAIPKGDITLSDGTNCWVKLKRRDLDQLLVYDEGISKINKAIEKILSENAVQSNKVQLILNGDSVNTEYFIDKLKEKYANVIGTPVKTQNEVLKLLFKSISEDGYQIKHKPSLGSSNSAAINTKSNFNEPPVVARTPPVLTTHPVVKSPPVVNTPPIVNTPPKVTLPPVINTPPILKTPPIVKATPVFSNTTNNTNNNLKSLSDSELKELKSKCYISSLKLIENIENLIKNKDVRQPQKGELLKDLNNIKNQHYEKVDAVKFENLTSLLLRPSDALYKGKFKDSEKEFLQKLKVFQKEQKTALEFSKNKLNNVSVVGSSNSLNGTNIPNNYHEKSIPPNKEKLPPPPPPPPPIKRK